MAERRVIIEGSNGERYSVTEGGYRDAGYEAAGFKIVSNEDGTKYGSGESARVTKADLIAEASGLGLVVDESMTKAAITEAIEAHRASAPPEG